MKQKKVDTLTSESNSAKGRTSFDANVAGELIPFFNRNVSEYPTEAGAPKIELIDVKQQKDIMINVARQHAEQEYNRIMDLVAVLQRQAQDIKRRLDITDMVHGAKYSFKPVHGHTYWLAHDTMKQEVILAMHGPDDWNVGAPSWYEYIAKVKFLGDYTWQEVKEDNNGTV